MPDHNAVASPAFEVRIDEEDQALRLIFCGELDLAQAPKVEAGFERAFENGARQVVVDLSELTFVDSTGIALFVLAKRRDGDGRLRFLPSNTAAVGRVLAITGVDEALGLLDGSVDGRASSPG